MNQYIIYYRHKIISDHVKVKTTISRSNIAHDCQLLPVLFFSSLVDIRHPTS